MTASITVKEAAELLESGEAILLDVREPMELKLAAVPGAMHIPLRDLSARAGTDLPPGRTILTLCHTGVRSAHAAAYLRRAGFADVRNVTGGIEAWARDLDPDVGQY